VALRLANVTFSYWCAIGKEVCYSPLGIRATIIGGVSMAQLAHFFLFIFSFSLIDWYVGTSPHGLLGAWRPAMCRVVLKLALTGDWINVGRVPGKLDSLLLRAPLIGVLAVPSS
jgi:hypothetical protein